MATRRVSVVELWAQLRGIENACRNYSDVLGAVMGMPQVGERFEIQVDEGKVRVFDDPWPNFCRPPWCWKLLPPVGDEMAGIANRLRAVSAVVHEIVRTLPPDTRIRYYASEIPGTFWPPAGGPPPR